MEFIDFLQDSPFHAKDLQASLRKWLRLVSKRFSCQEGAGPLPGSCAIVPQLRRCDGSRGDRASGVKWKTDRAMHSLRKEVGMWKLVEQLEQALRPTLKHLVQKVPVVRRLFEERDQLQSRCQEVLRECEQIRAECRQLKDKYQTVSQEHAQLYQEHKQLKEETGRGPMKFPAGHYYSPVPSIEEVRKEEHLIFNGCNDPTLPGIDLNEKGQLDLLESFKPFTREQPFGIEQSPALRSRFENPMYCGTEGSVIYFMMRHFNPKRIIEIGSGYSSCFTLDVNESFFNYAVSCTFIEPFPERLYSLIRHDDIDRIEIIESRLQDVNLERFSELQAGDILFVDSTHISKINSDVNYILFKILPHLQRGVVVHFHDIFYPFEYPKEWIYEGYAWNEAYTLRAFLQYNYTFQIIFFHDFQLRFRREEFLRDFPSLGWGQNIWLKKNR